jgi:hypothetical protein
MIFINYRRDDTSGNAGRIFDRLAKRFGTEAVFRDVATIGAGEDFRGSIQRKIKSSRVLLALIGPRWLTAMGSDGHTFDGSCINVGAR